MSVNQKREFIVGGSGSSSSQKRRCVEKSPRCCFEALPADVRLRIFQFASIDDLSNIAMTSRECRHACRDPCLSQVRIATIDCKRAQDIGDVLFTIREAYGRGVFLKFSRLRLINHGGIRRINFSAAKRFIKGIQLEATSLDLSLPTSVLQGSKKNRSIPACVPKFLSQIMPSLKEVDLTCVSVAQSALCDLARNCCQLEQIRWDHCDSSNVFASLQDLRKCRTLKALHMNQFHFWQPDEHENGMFESPELEFCPLYFCRETLERVSIKEATYEAWFMKKSFSQLGLIKFVRMAPTLRWFRSDLTPENVALLQQERPEITFL